MSAYQKWQISCANEATEIGHQIPYYIYARPESTAHSTVAMTPGRYGNEVIEEAE